MPATSKGSTPKSILVVSPEFAIEPDGRYRPSGLQLFARCFVASLVDAPRLERLEAWGLLDSSAGMRHFHRGLGAASTQLTTKGFSGNKAAMLAEFAIRNRKFDLVVFLHIRMAQMAPLRGLRPFSLWLVGIEVRRRLRRLERWVVRRSTPLLSISQYSSDEMRRFNPDMPEGLSVHLSVEPEGPWTQQTWDPLPYDAGKRKPAVLIVARLAASERYKGHDQLIEAWPAILAAVPGAELWITGSGDDEARLKAKAAALGASVSAHIKFWGRVSHDDLVRLYNEARVFAMPSTGEGFGLVFVEAMRAGVPCICGPDSAAEIVLDRETGIVVPQQVERVRDACIQLLTDVELANRMGRAGFVRFQEQYRFESMKQRVRAAYGFA